MRNEEEIKAIFSGAFKPLRTVTRLINWDNALEVRVLDDKNTPSLRPLNAPLNTLRDGDDIWGIIDLMRSQIEAKGITLDGWTRPI